MVILYCEKTGEFSVALSLHSSCDQRVVWPHSSVLFLKTMAYVVISGGKVKLMAVDVILSFRFEANVAAAVII